MTERDKTGKAREAGLRATAFPLIALALLAAFACGPGEEGGGRQEGKGQVTGDDVRREVGEAYRTTREYLGERMEDVQRDLEERMESLEEELERLQGRAAEAGERGRELTDGASASLREKQGEVRERYEEFRAASGELREKAAERLDRALTELEELYRKYRSEESAEGC